MVGAADRPHKSVAVRAVGRLRGSRPGTDGVNVRILGMVGSARVARRGLGVALGAGLALGAGALWAGQGDDLITFGRGDQLRSIGFSTQLIRLASEDKPEHPEDGAPELGTEVGFAGAVSLGQAPSGPDDRRQRLEARGEVEAARGRRRRRRRRVDEEDGPRTPGAFEAQVARMQADVSTLLEEAEAGRAARAAGGGLEAAVLADTGPGLAVEAAAASGRDLPGAGAQAAAGGAYAYASGSARGRSLDVLRARRRRPGLLAARVVGEPVPEAVAASGGVGDPGLEATVAADPAATALLETQGPASFEAGALALLESVDQVGLGAADEGAAPEAATASLDDEGAVSPDALDLAGFGVAAGGVTYDHSLVAGLLDTRFESTADGSTTTESRYIQHRMNYQWAFGQTRDLVVSNIATFDTLRNRDDLDIAYTRQVGADGYARVTGRLEIQEQKLGEAEPDYVTSETAVEAGNDSFTGPSWDARLYYRDQDYAPQEAFYPDSHGYGGTAAVRASGDGVDGEYRITGDAERYPASPDQDVDRLFKELTVNADVDGVVDLAVYSSDQREKILRPGLLDSYQAWFTEATISRALDRRHTLSYGQTFLSRSVDTVSAFLFDARERGGRGRLAVRFDEQNDGAVTYTVASSRSRDKVFGDGIDEQAENHERRDFELYLHHGGRALDASLTLYWGATEYVTGSSALFPNQDRFGVALTAGYVISDRLRADLTLSFDEEDYDEFPENDNEAASTGLSFTYQF